MSSRIARASVRANRRPILRGTATAAAAIMLLGASSSAAVAAPPLKASGSLDSRFGSGGIVTTLIGTATQYGSTKPTALTLQADGKVVVVGEGNVNYESSFFVARYGTSGSLDKKFGSGGIASAHFTPGYADYPKSVAMTADGKIVVAGSVYNGNRPGMVRLTANGALDTSFGDGGKVMLVTRGDIDDIALRPDGKIVAVGTVWPTYYPGSTKVAVYQFNADGSLDSGFDGDGVAIVEDGAQASSVLLQPDGKILVTEMNRLSVYDFELVRFNADGTLDQVFGNAGRASLDVQGNQSTDYAAGLALQGDGSIIVAGDSRDSSTGVSQMSLARFTSSGILDASFGSGGVTLASFGSPHTLGHAVAVDANGRIVVGGSSTDLMSSSFVVARFTPSGAVDTSFGTAGATVTGGALYGFGQVGVADLAIQPGDGKIVAAGQARVNNVDAFGITRYLP